MTDPDKTTPEFDKNQPFPKPDLISLARMLFMQGMIAAGKIPSPMTNKFETDANIANFQVQLFELIVEKTAGNRTQEEDQALDEMLHTLRMAYVDVSRTK